VVFSGLAFLPLYFLAGFALTAALRPVFRNLVRLRGRRIWALARLSVMEALRSRILWAFAALLLVFLFASWFLPYKPEDQVRNYVEVVYIGMTVLLVLPATMLAAFSIPGDLRRQTIHTIVTKPVERFEIVLGRFLGYTLLMTAVLAVMSLLSLIYVNRNIGEEAREESLMARVPVFGSLEVMKPTDVGEEWKYRQYIVGGSSRSKAVFTFPQVPAQLADSDQVRCGFTFDVTRTLKDKPSQEGRSMLASFLFTNARWQPEFATPYENDWQQAQLRHESQAETDNRLAEKYGCYKARSVPVKNLHTQFIEIPGALFREAASAKPQAGPPLRVEIQFLSYGQYLGMAQRDFFLVAANRSFNLNFFKGALGIWLRLCLVIGLALTCGTYLSGVISFLSTMFLYFAGLCLPFISELVERKNVGGGPMESILRLSRDSGPVVPLAETPAATLAKAFDQAFSFLLHPFLYFLPDVGRFTLTEFVASGFDIPAGMLFYHEFLPLVGYLLPWAILAFYLVQSREIAS